MLHILTFLGNCKTSHKIMTTCLPSNISDMGAEPVPRLDFP